MRQLIEIESESRTIGSPPRNTPWGPSLWHGTFRIRLQNEIGSSNHSIRLGLSKVSGKYWCQSQGSGGVGNTVTEAIFNCIDFESYHS